MNLIFFEPDAGGVCMGYGMGWVTGRLAMMAMLGFYAQTSTGSTPLANWAAHVADPWHMNVAVNVKALPFL